MILRRLLLILCLLIINCYVIFSIDFMISPSAFGLFPFGQGNESKEGIQRYSLGGGGNIGLEIDFASVLPNRLGIGYTLGVEAGMNVAPYFYDDGQINFYSAGGIMGLYFFPVSRLPLRIEGGIGIYSADNSEVRMSSKMWYRFGGETGFRFTPNVMLTLNGGWRHFEGNNGTLYSGFYAGLGARFVFEIGERSSGGVSVSLSQYDAVYPVLLPLYQMFPIGSVTIRNNENAEIRNVQVFFRSEKYTASEFFCGEAAIIPKSRNIELSLCADFSPEILRFTDNSRILGEIIIRYSFLGRERESVHTVSIAVNNRNTPVPGDNSALAAFVSPANPEILQFTKYAAALARTNRRSGLNRNMQTGIWLYETVKQMVSIEKFSDEVQFPSQTLAYGSGSVLDIALLYAAAIYTAGFNAAIIMFEDGETLTAIDLGVYSDDAAVAALFNGTNKLLIVNDLVYLPVAMSKINEGFTIAWQEAVNRINSIEETDEYAEFIIIDEAWEIYPSAPFPALGFRLDLPDANDVNSGANTAVNNYIQSEIEPKITELQEQINKNPSAILYNQLGNVYLRAGQNLYAKNTYEIAAGMGSIGAMVNLGNIALNENDLAAAEYWFQAALARDPENALALRGMDNVKMRNR